jgi:hypothetical protein
MLTKVFEGGLDILPGLGHPVEPVLVPGVHGHAGPSPSR